MNMMLLVTIATFCCTAIVGKHSCTAMLMTSVCLMLQLTGLNTWKHAAHSLCNTPISHIGRSVQLCPWQHQGCKCSYSGLCTEKMGSTSTAKIRGNHNAVCSGASMFHQTYKHALLVYTLVYTGVLVYVQVLYTK